ncbi:RNR1, partial [Symbiodinium necroappetens]
LGDVDGAKEWVEKMEVLGMPCNVVSWNALLKACRDDESSAEEVFRKMVLERGVQPDCITMTTLVGVLGKGRAKELCEESGVDYDSLIRSNLINREVKRADVHGQLSEQFRRFSRFAERNARAKHYVPWYRRKMDHFRTNLKKERLLEDRYMEIDRENRVLLKKMSEAMRKPNPYVVEKKEEKPPSLNRSGRKMEMIRITKDNARLLKSIQK